MALESIDTTLSFQYETGHYTFDISRLTLASVNPALAIQDKDTSEHLGYVTLSSINHEITKTRHSEHAGEATKI